MPQPSSSAPAKPLSRRGTPSTNEPISYFASSGNGSFAGTDFYSLIDASPQSSSQQTSAAAVASTGSQGAAVSQQSTVYHGTGYAADNTPLQQNQTYGAPHLPYGVPPRCATGPAVESPHHSYSYSTNNPHFAAPAADPYRSASVVYGGAQQGLQGAYHHEPAGTTSSWDPSGASFFDGHANSAGSAAGANAQQQATGYGTYADNSNYTNGYAAPSGNHAAYDTSAANVPAADASGTAAGGDEANGVVFDEASGQYYDTNSGQYYNDASGAWYYPQQQQSQSQSQEYPSGATDNSYAAPASDKQGDYSANAASPKPANELDGAAFFESLNATSMAEEPAAAPAVAPVTSLGSSAATPIPEEATSPSNVSMSPPAPHVSEGFSTSDDYAAYTAPIDAPVAAAAAAESLGVLQAVPPTDGHGGSAHAPVGDNAEDAEAALSTRNSADMVEPGREHSAGSVAAGSSVSESPGIPTAISEVTEQAYRVDSTVAYTENASAEYSAAGASDTIQPNPLLWDTAGVPAGLQGSTLGSAMLVEEPVPAASIAPAMAMGGSEPVSLVDSSLYYSQSYKPIGNTTAEAAPVATLGYESLDSQQPYLPPGTAAADAAGSGAYYSTQAAQSFVPTASPQTQPQPPHVSDQQPADLYAEQMAGAQPADFYAEQMADTQPFDANNLYGYASVGEETATYPQQNGTGYSDNAYAIYGNEAHGADATFPSDPAQHLYATSGDVESSASAQQQSIYADTPGGNEDAGMSLPQSEHGGTVPVNGTYSDTTTATDPLGRLTARYPIATFGFGGKMAVMFPRQVQRFNGYSTDGALKVTPGMLQIQSLSEHIPSNRGLPDSSSLASLPLVAGDLTRSALLKRRDAAIARAQACLETGPSTRTLSHVDRALYAVVIALLRAADQPDSQSLNLDEAIAAIRPLLAERHPQSQDECVREPAPISHGTVADLGDVEALLLDGKRDAAIDLACERGMWAHALIVASCTGKKTWQRVVQAYTEKGLKSGFAALSAQYCLFAGLGEDAFDELQGTYSGEEGASENGFITAADIGDLGSPETAPSHPGALDQSPSAESASSDIVDDWARVLMLALANRTPGDAAAMLKLGDRLKKRDQAVAAHICYALTLQNRDIFVRDHSSPRAILFGTAELDCSSKSPHAFEIARPKYSCYYREHGALFLTELYELAFALKNATLNESAAAKAASNGGAQASKQKGGNLLCLPHLQAYKLYYAWWLVDCGQMVQAAQYCDAVLGILATLPQGIAVPFIHASLVQELRNLRERLSGAGMTPAKAVGIAGDNAAAADANSKSWIARAVPRPSFTTLMTAFDSSIDKFITGADGSRISLEAGAAPGKYEVGPDRHGAPPAKISDQPPNPPRPLGATAWGGGANPANAPSQSDAYIPSYGSPRQSMDTARYSSTQTPVNGGSEPPRMYTPSSFAAHADVGPANATQPQWGDPGGVAQDAAQDGFIVPGMALGASAPGFIPEPVHSNGNTSSAPYQPSPQQAPAGGHDSNAQGRNGDGYADGEEDIFGFSKRVKTPVASAPGTTRPSVDAAWNKPASARPSTDMRARSDSQGGDKEASGVLGMIKSFWGGRKNQANLGEESQFVYDPVQRRWVDKNAPSDQQQSAPPPPPPPSAMRFQAQEMGDMRSGSAASLPPPSTGPSRTGTPMSIPDVGLPASRPPPPPSAPGARGGKRRGARSRYVDVLNQ